MRMIRSINGNRGVWRRNQVKFYQNVQSCNTPKYYSSFPRNLFSMNLLDSYFPGGKIIANPPLPSSVKTTFVWKKKIVRFLAVKYERNRCVCVCVCNGPYGSQLMPTVLVITKFNVFIGQKVLNPYPL